MWFVAASWGLFLGLQLLGLASYPGPFSQRMKKGLHGYEANTRACSVFSLGLSYRAIYWLGLFF